jgi:outer membrane protein TolC
MSGSTKRTIISLLGVLISGLVLAPLIKDLGRRKVTLAAETTPSSSVRGDQRTSQDELHRLLLERRQILQMIVESLEAEFKTGRVGDDQVREARVALMSAELDLCKTPAERLVVREKSVQLFKDHEDRVGRLVAAGQAPQIDAAKAKIQRLEAQIELVREKLAAQSRDR